MFCPNKKPTHLSSHRLAIVLSRPSHDEITAGEPLADSSGRILLGCLKSAGIPLDEVYIGYLNQHDNVRQDNIAESSLRLKTDLADYNCILVLGQDALTPCTNKSTKVSTHRGSLFKCSNHDSPLFGKKCIGSYSPKSLITQWDNLPLFVFDLKRAYSESETPELNLPQRDFSLVLTFEQCISKLSAIRDGDIIALDIEGGVISGMSCVSIATSPFSAFILQFSRYSPEDEARIMTKFAEVCANPKIGKILQHCLYDNFVLCWSYHCPIYGIIWDTMLSGWEIYPELPKGLGTLASIWTKEPYYKFERKIDDQLVHAEYCCKDSACTYEIYLAHKDHFTQAMADHFQFNLSLLPIFLYMELKGLVYDQEQANQTHAIITTKLGEIQTRINTVAREVGLDSVNLNSPKQVCDLLYSRLMYPKQHPKLGNRKDTTRTTSSVDALLSIAKKFNDQIIRDILAFRKASKLQQMLSITADKDSRCRSSYNVVGTDTGRLTCSKSPADTGMNLQTVTKSLRKLFRADPGYHLFQCDLAGADGWTVAAHCQRLGDSTMMDDYLYGIKPAKVIVLMYTHGVDVARWSIEQIKEASKSVSEEGKEGWLYFAAKRVQHGTNYALGQQTMSMQILKDSYNKLGKAIYVEPKECERLQQLYVTYRYSGIRRWQSWVQTELLQRRQLSCASGHIRPFFGRATDHTTYRTALSHEPQANTTYATNLAMSRLWLDPENRMGNSLIIQPLHQVHDAIIGQFPIGRTTWALSRIKSYFQNPLSIAGLQITIPFDGGYGPSWGELVNSI
jgi:uracil-DNA glycosylase